MNIGQVKVLSWGGAALLTAGLGLYVFTFVRNLDAKRRLPDPKAIVGVLEAVSAVKPKAADLVAYEEVRRLFLPSCERCKGDPNCPHLNWTGKPPAPPPTETEAAANQPPPRVAVADLVKILMVKVDLADRAQSAVYLRYKTQATVPNSAATGGFYLHEKEHLAAPHNGVRIEQIGPEGVYFAFDEEGRDPELLTPEQFDLSATIVRVGGEGDIMLPEISQIPHASVAPWRPPKTTAFGQNRWMLGLDDVTYANENFPKILADDLRTARHQDPRTGKFDGIEIQSVTSGSFAERHGAQEGDIVKSINGHPVSSVQEAISYARMNASQFTTWEVVVERNGKLQTFYFHSPQQ